MPILPPFSPGVLDTANTVLNSVRHRLNDKLPSLYPTNGKVLDNTSAFTQQCFNDGWRKLQESLANLGWTGLKGDTIVEALPVASNPDPASQQSMNWYTFFDGTNYLTTPVLPADLIHPLKIWERFTGQNMPFPDEPMECYLDGLPTPYKSTCNGMWEWRNNTVFMPGSLQSMDFRILYVSYLPDIVDAGSTRWFQQPVPITRCLEPLSLYVAHEFVIAREAANDEEAAQQSGAAKDFESKAEGATKLIFNRDVKMKQRVTVSRQPRSGRGSQSGYWGGGY